MFTKLFIVDLAERALSTFAQALIAVDITLTDLGGAFKPALLAALFSVLKGIAASYKGTSGSASLTVENVEEK